MRVLMSVRTYEFVYEFVYAYALAYACNMSFWFLLQTRKRVLEGMHRDSCNFAM